jgi:hypothetical protein
MTERPPWKVWLETGEVPAEGLLIGSSYRTDDEGNLYRREFALFGDVHQLPGRMDLEHMTRFVEGDRSLSDCTCRHLRVMVFHEGRPREPLTAYEYSHSDEDCPWIVEERAGPLSDDLEENPPSGRNDGLLLLPRGRRLVARWVSIRHPRAQIGPLS